MRRFFLFILICGMSSLYCSAQSPLFKSGAVKKDIFIELPFEVFHQHIIFLAEVNGVTQRFLFDTGAPNMIRREFLSTKVQPKPLKISDSQNQAGKMAIGLIDSLTLGGVNFYNYAAMDHDFSDHFPFSCYHIVGFIGSNLFRDLIVKIDWEGRKLLITDDLAKINPTTAPIKMRLDGQQLLPIIPFSFGENGKSKVPVLFDSGYNNLFTFSKKEYDKMARRTGLFSRVIDLVGAGSVGLYGSVTSRQYAATVNQVDVGSAVLKNMNITTSNGSTKVGTGLLAYGNVILDFKHKNFYFESNTLELDLSTDLPAYTTSIRDNKFVVGYILRDDLKSKMKSGDQIIGVDGVDISNLDPCDMLEISPRAKNRLQILSDGQLVEVEL